MPKMKTNSSAKKRFRVTKNGKVIRNHAFKNHILTKKSKKQKRNLTGTSVMSDNDAPKIKRLLCLR